LERVQTEHRREKNCIKEGKEKQNPPIDSNLEGERTGFANQKLS